MTGKHEQDENQMKNEIIITFEGDYVQAIANGEKNFAYATKLFAQIVQACKGNDCKKVLGLADTSKPL